jgi:heme/copper-type cytochrome/quinol oxidase subunit 2
LPLGFETPEHFDTFFVNDISIGTGGVLQFFNNPYACGSSTSVGFWDFYQDASDVVNCGLCPGLITSGSSGGFIDGDLKAPHDAVDISGRFYRNRSFIRLLEVDNPLILPYGVNIKLSITADDVIHSWAVPSFGIKIDAIPGRVNQAVIVVLHPGVFMGQCSELCGIYHSFMPINIEAVHPEVFFEEYNFTLTTRKDED